MGITDISALENKIQKVPYYQELFEKAYGSNEVTMDRIANSMGMFMRSINSTDTKLDRFMFQEEQLSALEARGMTLFIDKYDCNACHQVQSVTWYIEAGTFSNIGLDPIYQDDGLATVTSNESDRGRFKIPSLRNVALTGPYMHDGRFKTLSEVIDHYTSGIEDHPELDPRLRGVDNQPKKFNITRSEKDAIIAFLNTLTDHSMLKDPKFSNPFK
jgi:cytochrome c peroxidase